MNEVELFLCKESGDRHWLLHVAHMFYTGEPFAVYRRDNESKVRVMPLSVFNQLFDGCSDVE